MLKIALVFGVGLIEQCLYTAYIISVTKRQKYLSSLLMLVYMSLYLFIVAFALKDSETIPLLISYALACGCGNLLTMIIETRKNKNEKNKKL